MWHQGTQEEGKEERKEQIVGRKRQATGRQGKEGGGGERQQVDTSFLPSLGRQGKLLLFIKSETRTQ